MKVFALDTSTDIISMALSEDKDIIGSSSVQLERNVSSLLVPEINIFLKKNKMRIEKVDAFAVGIGPGSFTSLKVGLAAVKAFCWAQNKPVIGVSSLDAIAYGSKADDVTVICDARRNLLYASFYKRKKEIFKRNGPYLLADIYTVLNKVKKETCFSGNGIELYKDTIIEHLKHPCFAENPLWSPKAEDIISLAFDRMKKKKYDNIVSLVPQYLYKADCQVVPRK